MTLATTPSQPVAPYVFYVDLVAAIPWLVRAYGAVERMRLVAPGLGILQAELIFSGAIVMLGNVGPRNAGPQPATVRSGVYVYVNDVGQHFMRARDAGATIISEPVDQPYGDRMYLSVDLEGHEWYFAQHIRDITVEQLGTKFRVQS